MLPKASEEHHQPQEGSHGPVADDKKLMDLARDTADIHIPTPFTTDHGTRVSNTDNWLRVVDHSQTGPSLIEDQIAREKVY